MRRQLALFAMTALLVVACGGDDDLSATSQSGSSPPRVEMTMTLSPYLVWSPPPHQEHQFSKVWYVSTQIQCGTEASVIVKPAYSDDVTSSGEWPDSFAAEFVDIHGLSRNPLIGLEDFVIEVRAEGPNGLTTVITRPDIDNGWLVDESKDTKTAISKRYGGKCES